MSAFTCLDLPVALALSTLLLSFGLSAFTLLRAVLVKESRHE